MRENIGLFRGKRIDTGDWVEGYLTGALEGGFWIDESTKLGVPIIRRVIPDTVGECTGLRDKNGKMVFEGDAIKYKDRIFGEIVAVIEYSKGGCYCAHMLRSPNSPALDIVMNESEIEIIGNIHDNGELLKEGADE